MWSWKDLRNGYLSKDETIYMHVAFIAAGEIVITKKIVQYVAYAQEKMLSNEIRNNLSIVKNAFWTLFPYGRHCPK